MAISTATATHVWHRYRGGLAAKTSVIPRWEITAFTAAMLVALVHFTDVTTVHWQGGASPLEGAVQVVMGFAIPVLAALAYPYLRCGWRVVLALTFGFAGVSASGDASSGDYTSTAWLGAGLVLIATGILVLFASLPGRQRRGQELD